MKDFENQITELRKENFNLKLRIYFLEERMQQKFDGPNEDVYRINIELKVELESLKRELQERDRLLVKASKVLESLSQGGDAEIQRLKEEAHQNIQQVEETLARRISLLEEELKMAHEEAAKSFAMTERERVLRLAAEQQLALITNMQAKDMDVVAALEEKNRQIEQLSLSLKKQEALIQRLEEAASQSQPSEESLSAEKAHAQPVSCVHEKEEELEALRREFCNQKNDLEKRIQSLQEELCAREMELLEEKRNALKRDKTIQGLTLALKTKESENEELASEMEGFNASLAKAREAAHKAQLQKYKGAEDSQVLLMEKESLLADLRSENLTKDTENRKLQRRMKRTEQQLSDLHLEREKLVKELEEAQLQKSRSDKTVNDLRNQLEKMHDEMVEKGKAMERHYSVLLSEGNQKLQSQEAIIARLMDSVAQKDELLQKLDGVVKEKDTELQGWCAKFQSLLKDQELLRKENEDLIKEKSTPSDQRPMSPEMERSKESQYADMLEALRKERDVFSALIESLKEADGISNLQEEMNSIISLRKQLEEDILATWHLRKVLEEQIKENRREEESVSSWGDQTSYMSICLRARDYLVLEIDQLSLEELKKKITELVSVVKELHLENEDLRRKQLELSTSDPLAEEGQKSSDNSEFLESTEVDKTLTEAFDEESNMLSYPCPETVGEVIPSDCSDRQHRNLNKPEPEHESAVGKICSASVAGEKCGAQERSVLLNETSPALHGSHRRAEIEIANIPLDHLSPPERGGSSDDHGDKDEKGLERLVIQQRPESRKPAQVRKSPQPGAMSQPASTEKDALDAKPAPLIGVDVEPSETEATETARRTVTSEGLPVRQQHEGSTAASGDRGKSSRFDEDRWQREADTKSKEQETPMRTQKANKSDLCYSTKKSRLPVLLKPSRSLGSVSSSASSQKPDMHLLHRMFNLDEGLKGRYMEAQPLKDECPSNGTEKGTSEQEGILAGVESLIKLDDTEADVSLSSVGSQDAASGKDGSTSQVDPSLKLQGSEADTSFSSNRSKADPSSKDQSTGQEIETDKPESNLPSPDPAPAVPTKLDADTMTTASLLSLQPSVAGVEAFDCEATDDIKELKQRVQDLKSELAKYRTLAANFVGPNKELPSGDALEVVQDGGERLPDNGTPLVPDSGKPESRTSGDPQQAAGPMPVEDLASRLSEPHHEALVEKLQELLSENEVELEKEQIANMHLLDKVCRLQRRLKGVLLEGPDSPVRSPAPEDQCQKIRESHTLCVAYRQHLTNLIRAFEELLQASEVDYYVAEGFREQLNRSARLFEHLEEQCLYGGPVEDEAAQLGGLTRSLSYSEISQKSSSLEPPGQDKAAARGGNETLPVTPSKLPPELLMEHLHEIRMLRHQLEESIKTNDRLRKQLEQQVTDFARDQGSASACIHGLEPRNSRSSEIHFLRDQNQLLNVMLAKGSQDRQKENEKLRESLGKKSVTLEHLHKACELLKKENLKLQTRVGKQEGENGRLTHEIYNLRNELNRLQMELSATQHQLAKKDHLLPALQMALKMYEKLDNAIRSQTDGSWEEGWKDQNPPLDLNPVLTEIQTLRAQLERSVTTSQMWDGKPAEPFWSGKADSGGCSSTVTISRLFKQESQLHAGLNEFKFPTAEGSILELQQKYGDRLAPLKADTEPPRDPSDASSRCSSSTSRSQDSSLVPRHCVWADKNGRHVLGSIEDYNSLREQITEGQKLLSELELPIKDMALLEPGAMVFHQASLDRLSAAVGAIRRNLEEAARLLKLLWRVSLPMKVVHGAAYSLQDETLRAEVQKLRRKLAEQEKKLHSTVKHLHSTNRLKENMEKVIIDQLALTHDVLRKARGNLELQPAENKTSTFSPSKKRVL
nr:CDK5 regulatory subunit-associated protein 2 [Pogona vitticeps]